MRRMRCWAARSPAAVAAAAVHSASLLQPCLFATVPVAKQRLRASPHATPQRLLQCIMPWLETQHKCPICRYELQEEVRLLASSFFVPLIPIVARTLSLVVRTLSLVVRTLILTFRTLGYIVRELNPRCPYPYPRCSYP